MDWNLQEAISYYQKQGAPRDQSAVVSLLKEIQRELGSIPQYALGEMVETLGVKEGFFLALIKRIPGLRLGDTHSLELCGGPNCSRRGKLADFVEATWGKNPKNVTVKQVPCMRQCGKGPNIRWDGKLYNGADEALLRRLMEGKTE